MDCDEILRDLDDLELRSIRNKGWDEAKIKLFLDQKEFREQVQIVDI